jgi:hypothetical protein
MTAVLKRESLANRSNQAGFLSNGLPLSIDGSPKLFRR